MKAKNSKIIATIEARMGSKRLPGKVLLPVLGKPILFYLVERLKAVSNIDGIILATTQNPQDDPLEDFAYKHQIDCFRGSEEDVMGRVIGAGERSNADIIVEITGDCPLIDIDTTELVISTYCNNHADYVSNCHIRSYPDGMDVQVFSLKKLKLSASMTSERLDREHVSLHIRNNPKIFTQINLIAPRQLRRPQLGLTLDEISDFEVIKAIIEELYPIERYFNCKQILEYLDQNSEIAQINQHVIRKNNA